MVCSKHVVDEGVAVHHPLLQGSAVRAGVAVIGMLGACLLIATGCKKTCARSADCGSGEQLAEAA